MSRIAGFPAGLLSLLQSQNFGEAPRELGEVIAPVVDLAALYMVSQQQSLSAVSNPIANGVNVTTGLTVPPTELWCLHHASTSAAAAVGESVAAFAPFVRQNGIVTILSDPQAVAASQVRWAASDMSAPLWLPAGCQIGIYADGVVGVPIGGISAFVTRLRA